MAGPGDFFKANFNLRFVIRLIRFLSFQFFIFGRQFETVRNGTHSGVGTIGAGRAVGCRTLIFEHTKLAQNLIARGASVLLGEALERLGNHVGMMKFIESGTLRDLQPQPVH